LGLTQQDLALAAGVSYQQIQKYERGTNRVSASRLFLISEALEISPLSFFENLGNNMQQSGKIRSTQQIDRTLMDDQVNEALTNLVNALKETTAQS
jgi:transcriptional regulator with XRE-family HTH domain